MVANSDRPETPIGPSDATPQKLLRVALTIIEPTGNENGTCTIAPNKGPEGMQAAFGTRSFDAAESCLRWLIETARKRGKENPTEQELNAALAMVQGLKPENEAEALLIVQMVSIHGAAIDLLVRSQQETHWKLAESCGIQANRLFRTFTAQFEALAKMRRGGEQTIRVEYHVHQGAQAIIGNVSHAARGGG
jgi:hypothetical protein